MRCRQAAGSAGVVDELSLVGVDMLVELSCQTAHDQVRHAQPVSVAYDRQIEGVPKVIATIQAQPVIARIFTPLGLLTRDPPAEQG